MIPLQIQMLLVGAETSAIVLPLVAIVLSIAALRDSRANYERSLTALATITERAALTERIIGAHIEKIVGTILSVTNAMAVSPEVRKAELDRLGEEQHARVRSDTIRSLSEAIKWSDPQKLNAFVRIIEAIEGARRGNSSSGEHRTPQAPAASSR